MGLSHPGTLKSEGGEVYSAALKLTKDRDEKGMCQVDFNNVATGHHCNVEMRTVCVITS